MKKSAIFSFLLFVSFAQIASVCVGNNLPHFGFIENNGQVHDQFGNSRDDVRFIFGKEDFYIILRNTGFSYEFTDAIPADGNFPESGSYDEDDENYDRDLPIQCSVNRVDVDFKGCLPNPQIFGELPFPNYTNYFNQYTGQKGITKVQNFKQVVYKNIYKNIDLVFSLDETGGQYIPKYEFILHDGADAGNIRMSVSGHDQLNVAKEGGLTLTTHQGFINETKPIIISSDRKFIKSCSFVQKGNTIAFSNVIKPRDYPCIIDPEISWGTYYGGKNKELTDEIATDHEDNIYMTARVRSGTMIATAGSYQSTYAGNGDASLIKFDGNGNLLYGTYYGGSGTEISFAITIDPFDNPWISGHTDSPSGIVTSDGYDITYSGGYWDVFVSKFNADGILLYATYMGDEWHDEAQAMCSNQNGDIYVSGYTESATAMATPGAFKTTGSTDGDAFLEKFSNDGHLLYGTYFGGIKRDRGHGVHVDNFGHVYQLGTTNTKTGITTSGAYQAIIGGVNDAFLIKWTEAGQLMWCTYFGGEGDDRGRDVKTDLEGNVYLVGQTESEHNIATPGVFKDSLHFLPDKNRDAFVAKFDSNGNRLWATYFGGNAIDMPRSLRVDPNGAPIYISGYTRSKDDFSTPDAYNIRRGGGNDAFFAIINWNGSKLLYSTYYGGRNSESVTEGGWYGPAMDLDSQGSIYLSSCTNSDDSIATAGAYDTLVNDTVQYDLFLVKFLNPCIDAFESQNNDFATAPALLFNSATNAFSVKGTLEGPNDKDYLRITGPQGFDSLYFHLTNLPFDCNLFVYDHNQQIIDKSQNGGTSDEELVIADSAGATYYVLVKSPTHQFGANACYKLNISVDGSGKHSLGNKESTISLFPNPADDKVTLTLENDIAANCRIQVLNQLGMVVYTQQKSLSDETSYDIDVRGLPNGTYIVQMTGTDFSLSKKLIVQH